MKKNLLGVCFLAILFTGNIFGQKEDSIAIVELQSSYERLNKLSNENKPSNNNFRITGFADANYQISLDDFPENSFVGVEFSPIFLFKPTKRLFFESELHIGLESGNIGGQNEEGEDGSKKSVSASSSGSVLKGAGHGGEEPQDGQLVRAGSAGIDLGYANINYLLTEHIIVSAGYFLTPLGTFGDRYHPSWINRMPDAPLGLGHGSIVPSSELGIQIKGGIQTGSSKLNYAIYISNGPMLEDGSIDTLNAGKLVYNNFLDNNINKALGGRIGFLPLSNSSLEVGVSWQSAKPGDKGSNNEDVRSFLYAVDLAFVKDLNFLKGMIRLYGQYNAVNIGQEAIYINDMESITEGQSQLYSIKNNSYFYYVQLSYSPTKMKKDFIKNFELVGRYDQLKYSPESKWASENVRWTIGLNYWLYSRSAIKLAAQFGEEQNIFQIQWTLGF